MVLNQKGARETMAQSRLDRDIDQLVSEHGMRDVIFALANYCDNKGMASICKRLLKIYGWLLAEG